MLFGPGGLHPPVHPWCCCSWRERLDEAETEVERDSEYSTRVGPHSRNHRLNEENKHFSREICLKSDLQQNFWSVKRGIVHHVSCVETISNLVFLDSKPLRSCMIADAIRA